VNVARNNSFRHIFSGFWWENVKPLQYYTATLPISYFIDQRQPLFWRKLAMHNNNFLLSFRGSRETGFMPLAACILQLVYYNNVGFSWSN